MDIARLSIHGWKKLKLYIGHGQSGDFFRYKTTFLRKSLEKGFRSLPDKSDQLITGDCELVYLNAPHSPFGDERYIWGSGDFERDRIYGLEQSIQLVVSVLDESGPFIGIVGFSTGAMVAAIITSLLERPDRCAEFNVKV